MTAVGIPLPQNPVLHEPDAMQLAEDLADVVERAQALISSSGAIIALRSYESLVVRTSDGVAPEVGTRIPFPSGVTGLCATTRKPQSCDTDDLASQLENAFRAVNARSVMAVPIVRNAEAIGVLAVVSQTRVVFTRTHVAVLMTLADVAGSKLAEWPALWNVAPKPAPPAEVLDLDVDSLLGENSAASAPAPAKPGPAATLQIVPPSAPATAFAQAPKEAAAPGPSAPRKVVVTVPRRASILRDEPTDAPVSRDPDVLLAAEDPTQHGSVITRKPEVIHVPSAAAKAVALHSYTPYRTAKSKPNYMPLFAGCGAVLVLVLGLGIAFYPRHKSVEPAPAAAATQPAPATPEASRLVAVPVKTADVPPPVVASTASSPAAVKNNDTARPTEPPKPAAELPVPAAPAIELAAGQAKAKPEEVVASPSLGLVASSGKVLPDLSAMTPAAAAPVHRPVAAVLVPAKRLQGVAPQFPQDAQRRGESGSVTLIITISSTGKVTDARVVNGNPVFVPYSIAAVRQWVYSPARLDGKPVESTAEVSLRFNAVAR